MPVASPPRKSCAITVKRRAIGSLPGSEGERELDHRVVEERFDPREQTRERPPDFHALAAGFLPLLERARELGETLRTTECLGTADDDRITATATAVGALTRIDIDTYAKRELDNLTLGDAIAQAINRALDAADRSRSEALDTLRLNGIPVTRMVAE